MVWATSLRNVVVAATLPLWAGRALAQSTEALLQVCRAPDSASQGVCLGYITGVADMMIYNAAAVKSGAMGAVRSQWLMAMSLCSASPPSRGSMQQVFVNWARANPKQWTLDEGVGVAIALKDAWPC